MTRDTDKMANLVFLYSILIGVMLLASFHPVQSDDLTLQASASQSHPMEGHSTELTCNVRSMNQSQVIIWSKDQSFITWGDTMGQMMSSRFDLVMSSMNDSQGTLVSYTLIINDITRDDDGRYQCQVLQENGNGYSAMASETVVLSVLYFPASVFPLCSLNGSQTLLTGTELTVSCTSAVGNPQISSMWVGADDTVEQPVYHTVESSSMMISELELTATRDLEGATYICRVISPAYPDFDRTCSLGPLRIMDWPTVTVTRSVPRVTEGGDVHFLCDTEPRMPVLNWVTVPPIDPDRLAVTDGGAILTVRNVQKGDNLTNVVCRVPYRDTQLAAQSVILVHESNVTLPSGPPFHATTQLCIPWFGAFLFTVAVNLVLCIIIVHLLMKVKKLTPQSKAVESDEDSLSGVDSAIMEPKKSDIVLTWPATRQSVSSANWSMWSEKSLRDQRRKSWQHIQPDDDEMTGREMLTYTELSPDTMERGKSRKKQLRKSVSLSGINDPPDSDSYITPNTHPNPMAKAATSSPVKISRKNGQSSVLPPSIKAHTSKTARPSRKGGIKSISERIPMEPSNSAAMSSYMDLGEKTEDFPPQKQTYQALQKTPYSSRYASQPVASSIKKSRKKSSQDMDDMTGASGIYGDSGSYIKHGGGDMPSTNSDGSRPAQRRDSMMGESASYMPVDALQRGRTKATINQHRSGTLSSQSSDDTHDNRYEIPPDAGSTDDSTGEAVYAKSLGSKSKGIQPRRGQSRGTVSSRAPLPDPAAVKQKDVRGDTASTDGSYKEPYRDKHGDNRVYFVLDPDRGSFTNYGADISSESDSYQGAETFDTDPAHKAAKSAPPARKSSSSSEKSYLELGDAEGEIKGYMDMTKVKPEQLKRPADVTKAPSKSTKVPAKSTKLPAKSTKLPAKSTKVPAKFTKQAIQSDSECSSNEYYEQMEGSQQSQEYAVPPSSKLKLVVEEIDPRGAGNSESSSERGRTPSSVEPEPKKKGGWGPFRK